MMNLRLILPTGLFTLVTLLSFSIWAFGSRIFNSEPSLYAMCALVFLGLGGLALTPGSILETKKDVAGFCIRFAVGFAAYAFLWSISWFTFRDTFGEILGSFLGLLTIIAILRRETTSTRPLLTATAVVFLWHTLGYYTGGLTYQALQGRGQLGIQLPFEPNSIVTLARLSWGLFFGLGFGIGLVSLIQRPRTS